MASDTYYYAYVGKEAVEEQMIILNRLEEDANAWIEIRHDRDEAETHHHLLFSSYSKIKSIQKKLGNNVHLEQLQNPKAYARYMLHETEESKEDGKAEYKISELIFSSKRFITELGLRQTGLEISQVDKAHIILKLLEESRTIHELVINALDNGVYDELRRGFNLWKTLWKEKIDLKFKEYEERNTK